jgi:hypothetical protein
VQFFGTDEQRLVENVARYFADGLSAGSGVLIVGSAERNVAIVRELVRVGCAQRGDERITTLDAAETLAGFMSGERPDPKRFDASVGACVRRLHAAHGHLRAYGEMVGLLWAKEQTSGAIALEELWNELLRSANFDLYCGYPIDVLGPEFQVASVDALLATHTDLVSATDSGFERAIERAMDEVLGPPVGGLRLLAMASQRSAWPALPLTERTALWLRNNLPRYADEILGRARAYYAG